MEIEGVVLRERKFSPLQISRVPNNSRNKFVELAVEEFASDYGLCLASILEDALELRSFKKMIFNGDFSFIVTEKKMGNGNITENKNSENGGNNK